MSDEESTPPLGSIGHDPVASWDRNPNNSYSSDGYLMSYGSPQVQQPTSPQSGMIGGPVTSDFGDRLPWVIQALREIFRKQNIPVWLVAIGLSWLPSIFHFVIFAVIGNLAVFAALLISSRVLRQIASRIFAILVVGYIAYYVLFVVRVH